MTLNKKRGIANYMGQQQDDVYDALSGLIAKTIQNPSWTDDVQGNLDIIENSANTIQQASQDSAAALAETAQVKGSVGNLTLAALSGRASSSGPQFADGSRWVWKSSGTPNGGTIVSALGGGVWVREYAGPVLLKWFITGQNITTALQAAVNAAKSRVVYGREVSIDPPVDWPYYIVTDTITLPHGVTIRNTGSTSRPQTGEDAEGSFILFAPGALSSKALFTHATQVAPPSNEGYAEPTTLINITAQLQVASRGGGASYFDCNASSKLLVQGGYIDRFDKPVRGNYLIDTEFRGVTFRSFQTAITVTGADSTTVTFYKCYFKGNTESNLVFDFGADAVYNSEFYSCIFESVKQIGKVQKGSNVEFHGCYSENIGYDGSALAAFEVAKTGSSAKPVQSGGSLRIFGGVWHGINGTVNDNSTFIDADYAHQIVVIGAELARFARAQITTANTGYVTWKGNTFVQMGTANQPDVWRGIANWTRFTGERTKNRIAGFLPTELVASRFLLQSLTGGPEWRAYSQYEQTDSDLCFDLADTRKARLDNTGTFFLTGATAPKMLTKAALLAMSAAGDGRGYLLSDPAAGKGLWAVSLGGQWRYASDGSVIT